MVYCQDAILNSNGTPALACEQRRCTGDVRESAKCYECLYNTQPGAKGSRKTPEERGRESQTVRVPGKFMRKIEAGDGVQGGQGKGCVRVVGMEA